MATKSYVKQIGASGMEFINQEIIEKQRNVMSYMFKTVGRNIIEGKSIMNVSLPINLSDYRTQCEV